MPAKFILSCATAFAILASPALAQQTTTVTGTQTTSSGQNAQLDCAQLRLPRNGSIVAASTKRTNGFWINRGSALLADFGQAQQAVGFTLRANDTYYICPNSVTGSTGASSVTVTVKY